MLPGRRNDPRDSSARSMGEEWAVETGDGGEGRKSGHTSQSSPAGGLKSCNGVPQQSILFSENKMGQWLGGRARALRV